MSLYGALFGAVSGLNAQSSKIGVISDNIANSNTIGYKSADATFESLVINASSEGIYQTGGVRVGTRSLIDRQGLLQSTESSTDIAISGGGFFVVRAVSDGSTSPLYTRAGSFSQDSLGNFVNTAGYFLQGWPLDREGRLPGEVGNLNTTSFTNFDSLVTVNVESASGTASSTTTVSLGANLRAGESVFPGVAATLVPDSTNTRNFGLAADQIVVGAEYGLANTNGVRRGDQFTIATGGGQDFTFEYGGFAVGRQVTDADVADNYGDGGTDNASDIIIAANALEESSTTASTYLLTIPGHNLITGDRITLSGYTGVGVTPDAEINDSHVITWVDENTISFTVDTDGGADGTTYGDGTQTADIRRFEGTILDANSTSATFLGETGVSGYSDAALTFTITTENGGTRTFTYVTGSPNSLDGEFNNLTSLANAIDDANGLTARVVNGRLVVSAEDASESITFANGDADGDTDAGETRGIDWITELDLKDVETAGDIERFNSLQSLADAVEATDGLSASIDSPLSSSSLEIILDDPQDTMQFTDLLQPTLLNDTAGAFPIELPTGASFSAGDEIEVTLTVALDPAPEPGDFVVINGLTQGLGGLPGTLPNGRFEVVDADATTVTVTMVLPQDVTLVDSGNGGGNGYDADTGSVISVVGVSNHGSLLAHFGLVDSLAGVEYVDAADVSETDVLGPEYDATGAVGSNMASGEITAQFSRNVRIFDGLGSGHDIRFSFIKIAENQWAMEIHAIPETDVTTSGSLVDGQIAVGTVSFNGDGTLRSVDSSLTDTISINWTNGAIASEITLDLGTQGEPFGTEGATQIGLADGLSQFDSGYNVNFANQNGAPVGQLVSVAIDGEGIVVASYSNGQTQSLFQLPLADFSNPNGLQAVTGNVFAQTRSSGEVNLREAGSNGTGNVVASTLEQANVDIAAELTDMIVAQRTYQANTRVISVADELLERLNQI